MKLKIPITGEFHIKYPDPRFCNKKHTVTVIRRRFYDHQAAEMIPVDIYACLKDKPSIAAPEPVHDFVRLNGDVGYPLKIVEQGRGTTA